MQVLVCYATSEGQTRKIAALVADLVRAGGHEPDLVDATAADGVDPARYRAAILAGSVHVGRYQSALVHRIHQWRVALGAMPSAFVSVSLAFASDHPHERAEVEELCRKMLEAAGWTPDMTLQAAGAIRFSRYDFFKRMALRLIARHEGHDLDPRIDHEFTDWDAVRRFVAAFLARLPAGPG